MLGLRGSLAMTSQVRRAIQYYVSENPDAIDSDEQHMNTLESIGNAYHTDQTHD